MVQPLHIINKEKRFNTWSRFQAKELASRGAFACTQLDDMDKISSGQLIFTVFSSRTFHFGHV